jgi:hypothetical protein
MKTLTKKEYKTPIAQRPTDAELVMVIADHYKVSTGTAAEWLVLIAHEITKAA